MLTSDGKSADLCCWVTMWLCFRPGCSAAAWTDSLCRWDFNYSHSSNIKKNISCLSLYFPSVPIQSFWMLVQTVCSSWQRSLSLWAVRDSRALQDGLWGGRQEEGRHSGVVMVHKILGVLTDPLASSQTSPHYQTVVFTGVKTMMGTRLLNSTSLCLVQKLTSSLSGL